jgi:6-phosphogluconolactonase
MTERFIQGESMVDERKIGRTARTAFVLTGWLVLTLAAIQQDVHAASKSPATARSYFVYVGTDTSTGSKGVYSYRFDPKTGQLTPIGVAAEVATPFFLATDPQYRFLYATTERGEGHGPNMFKVNGHVSSYSIDRKTGALTFLNRVETAGGGPAHLATDNTGKMLFVANYGSGSIVSFAIKPDGSIGERTGFDQHTGSGPDHARQEGPHAHEAVLSPDNRFLLVPDLGSDQIKIYRVDAAKGTFTPNDPAFATVKAGLGPRHLLFGKGGKFVYVVCEMGSSVVVFSYDPVKGSLTEQQTIANLPPDFTGIDNSAELGLSRSGKFLYASNREAGSITVFAIDPVKGTLTRVQIAPTLGKIPRNFAIDPTGKYVVVGNQMSNQMVVFAIDQANGELKPTGQTVDISTPVCILFVPAL